MLEALGVGKSREEHDPSSLPPPAPSLPDAHLATFTCGSPAGRAGPTDQGLTLEAAEGNQAGTVMLACGGSSAGGTDGSSAAGAGATADVSAVMEAGPSAASPPANAIPLKATNGVEGEDARDDASDASASVVEFSDLYGLD